MKNRTRQQLAVCALICLTGIVTGCASLGQRPSATPLESLDTEAVVAELTPAIETLYLSWREFNDIYKDIKFLERGFLFDPDDRQLGYIQQAALYTQDASVRIRHVWEQLSVLHYVRSERMRDYLTLSVNALTDTIDEIGYDDRFIDIYAAFIEHAPIRGDLDRARNQLVGITALLKEIRATIDGLIR